jgi:hypothetical protein
MKESEGSRIRPAFNSIRDAMAFTRRSMTYIGESLEYLTTKIDSNR